MSSTSSWAVAVVVVPVADLAVAAVEQVDSVPM